MAGILIGSFASGLAGVVQLVVYLVPRSELDSAWMRAYASFSSGFSGVLARAIFGFCLGIAQAVVIRRWVSPRRWVVATIVGFLLVVPLDYVVSFFEGPSGYPGAVGIVLLRAAGGLVIGAGQGVALRRGVGDAVRWALAIAAAWVLWTFAARLVPIHQTPGTVSIVALYVSIIVTLERGFLLGATTAFLLARWSRRWPDPAQRRRRHKVTIGSVVRAIAELWRRFEAWPGQPTKE